MPIRSNDKFRILWLITALAALTVACWSGHAVLGQIATIKEDTGLLIVCGAIALVMLLLTHHALLALLRRR